MVELQAEGAYEGRVIESIGNRTLVGGHAATGEEVM